MQPCFESLLDHTDGAPPKTPTNRGHGITSRPLKHDRKASPRDSKGLRTDHLLTYINSQEINTYIMHWNFIPTSITNPHLLHVEPIPTRVANHEKSVSPHTNIMPLNYQSSMFTVVHAIFVTTYISNPSYIIHIRSCQTHHSLHVSPPLIVYDPFPHTII